jgi:hypothetical protein
MRQSTFYTTFLLIFIVGCVNSIIVVEASAQTDKIATQKRPSEEAQLLGPENWPTTVVVAVKDIISSMSEEDKETIRRISKDDLIQFHHGWGTGIRNYYGLWRGNDKLREDACGEGCHPDDASMVIIEKVWESLRNEIDPELIMKLDCQHLLAEKIEIDTGGFYRLTIGDVINEIQRQINVKLSKLKLNDNSKCELKLPIRIKGDPDLLCWTRAEFSEEGSPPVPLSRLLGWIGFRNSFKYQHNPPYLDFIFYKKCSWPEPPKHFWPSEMNQKK